MQMDELTFGEVLRSFRQYKNMTKEELAENICTIDELISFERGLSYPTLDVLYSLAFKLNVELTYLFDIVSKTNINYPTTVMKIIERYKRERNYEAIYNIIEHEQKNPLFSQKQLQQYLFWHLGICTFYLDHNFDKAIEQLYQAIEITNPNKDNLNEKEIEILTSISILHYETKNFHMAINIFFEALTNLNQLPDILNSKIRLKILFGLAQSLTEVGKYQESIEYCETGIQYCINEENLFLLLEFHYQLGENFIKIGNYEKGKEHFDKCLFLLKIERKDKLHKIIEEEIGRQLSK